MEKINSIKLAEILEVSNNVVDADIYKVILNSKDADNSSLFVAIKGEHTDGHKFAAECIKNGCPLVVVDHYIDEIPENRQLVVEDTIKAYGKIGAYNRSLYKGTLIGITGSAGKTSTKEMVKLLLSEFGKTYATNNNQNNFIGVPLTLCNLDMDAEYAIVEMGTSSYGEIAYLTDLVKPDIALITNIFPMHIEYFNSVEEIAQEKATIFKGLNGNKKIAIINEDSNCFDILMNKARKYTDNILCYGKNNQPNVDFSLCDDSEQYKYYAWCALSIINSLGLDINKAAKKIADFKPLIGRGKKHSLNIDNGKYTLIDDSYSGQPASMILGIKSLDKQYCKGKKIAVIGKMSELGKHSQQFHIEVGQELAKSSINTVIGVCPETKDILEQLPNSMNKYYFENNEGLADFLLNEIIEEEDVVFIKGAHYSSRVFEVAEKLIETGADK